MPPPLPPYSTFWTNSKQQILYPQATSHGNILAFTPPGFQQELQVKFPDSRLPVCIQCKKSYRTRELCRVRSEHTGLPWSTAYVCITIDESCLDAAGTAIIDQPMTVRMVSWQPFCVKKSFNVKTSTPVCAICKRTNRTRAFCRERHRHRHLPWCTVYGLLSALDQTDPNTVVAGASRRVGEGGIEKDADGNSSDSNENFGHDSASSQTKSDVSNEVTHYLESDNINEIPKSRTFLATVSYRGCSMHWLEKVDLNTLCDADPYFSLAVREGYSVDETDAPLGYVAAPAPEQQHVLDKEQETLFQMSRLQQQQQQQPQSKYAVPLLAPFPQQCKEQESIATTQLIPLIPGAPFGVEHNNAPEENHRQIHAQYLTSYNNPVIVAPYIGNIVPPAAIYPGGYALLNSNHYQDGSELNSVVVNGKTDDRNTKKQRLF